MIRGSLLLLIFPALCLAHSLHYRTPPPACPEHICICSMGKGQQLEANCKELPKQRLNKTITALSVSGQITKITKKMIATLGGDLLSLDLNGCEIQTIEPGSFDGVPKLVTLKLSNNQMEEIGPGTFKKNTVLKELYLDGNKLKHIDESAFSKLEQLRELHLERNYLTQFPSKIPIGLTVLNVSQNNLGPELGCEIHETNLKELNLCGNHLEKLTNTTLHALNKLQSLCVGDRAVHFPKNMATYLPHLSDLSLVASTGSHAELDTTTQQELAEMGTLTSLTIVNYKLQSLSFLHSLTKLRHLTLRDITTPEPVDFQSILLSKTSLTVLDLEGSRELARSLLDRMQVLAALGALRTVVLRNTGITHLAWSDIPRTDGAQVDISSNPLDCGCGFAWLKAMGGKDEDKQRFLVNVEETRCAAPPDRLGEKLTEAVERLDCPSQDREIRDSSSFDKPDRPAQYWPPRQPHQDKWGRPRPPMRFPTHRPDQGSQAEFPPQHNQGSDSEFPTHHLDQDNESEFPTQHNQGGEIEFHGDPDTTIEPTVTGSEPQGTETEPTASPTSDSDRGTPEHMSIHEADSDASDYAVVYIVLGSLLGLLILVGLILAAFYWHFKRTGGNKVKPTTTDNTPVEPSFQQLQHTEGSSLLQNVKK